MRDKNSCYHKTVVTISWCGRLQPLPKISQKKITITIDWIIMKGSVIMSCMVYPNNPNITSLTHSNTRFHWLFMASENPLVLLAGVAVCCWWCSLSWWDYLKCWCIWIEMMRGWAWPLLWCNLFSTMKILPLIASFIWKRGKTSS